MGCDIHLYTEYLKHVNGNEQWVNCDNWRINPYFGDEGEGKYEINPVYNNRSYSLFAILADVRNYSENEPISQPKGLPDNVHYLTKSESDRWGCDGHSHSYLTLAEIKEYAKKHPNVKYSGKMSPENAVLVDAGEMPEMWCADTTIDSYVYREWEHKNETLYGFIETLEKLKRELFWIFDEQEHPEFDVKLRIVFWFDN